MLSPLVALPKGYQLIHLRTHPLSLGTTSQPVGSSWIRSSGVLADGDLPLRCRRLKAALDLFALRAVDRAGPGVAGGLLESGRYLVQHRLLAYLGRNPSGDDIRGPM